MKYPVTQFKSLAAALKEMEPFVRNGQHLRTGKRFEKIGGMRSREILANWLVCVATNAATEVKLTFCSDPIGGDGIICDAATGETWPTEQVMVPRPRAGQTDDAETLILKAIDHSAPIYGPPVVVAPPPPTDAQVIAGTILGIAGLAIDASMYRRH